MERKNLISLIIIVILALVSFAIVLPKSFNKGINFINSNVTEPVGITIPETSQAPFHLSLDLQGGTRLVYRADLAEIPKAEREEKMDRLKQIIQKRIQGRGAHGLGVREPVVTVQQSGDNYRLSVALPGIKEPQKAIELIGKTPYLEFKQERDKEKRKEIINKYAEKDKISKIDISIACKSREFISGFIAEYGKDPCFKPTELDGEYLKGADIQFKQTGVNPGVALKFDARGSKLFEKITEENKEEILGVYIDNRPISLPVINEKIPGGQAQITGKFSVEEAKELAGNLDMGALPVPIEELVSQTTIGPTLGSISLNKSLKAALYGFLAVILYMILVYRLPGLLATISLVIYGGILLSFFKIIPITLSLAGIGGAILSVGMAVDANVLIFERQKEEIKREESFSKVVKTGLQRAWPSIRDSNFTTLLVALIMFSFGTSFIKGFSVALILGILVSLFSALFITETFIKSFAGTRLAKIKWLWK